MTLLEDYDVISGNTDVKLTPRTTSVTSTKTGKHKRDVTKDKAATTPKSDKNAKSESGSKSENGDKSKTKKADHVELDYDYKQIDDYQYPDHVKKLMTSKAPPSGGNTSTDDNHKSSSLPTDPEVN